MHNHDHHDEQKVKDKSLVMKKKGKAIWHGVHLKQKIKFENRKMFEGEVFHILVVLPCATKKMHNARPR